MADREYRSRENRSLSFNELPSLWITGSAEQRLEVVGLNQRNDKTRNSGTASVAQNPRHEKRSDAAPRQRVAERVYFLLLLLHCNFTPTSNFDVP
jgi:hypothetical protein